MRVLQSRVPKRAGEATLSVSLSHDRWAQPQRDDDEIVIPVTSLDEWEFHPLKGGEQFLLSRIHPGEGIWFGGTDERPFLVQLKLEALDHFEADGEAGFFEALKPEVIQNHEQEWGVDRTKRQGDIFAYPLPWSWWQFLRNNWVEGQEVKLAETSVAAFGTRHRFTGKIANVGRQTSIVEGILEAPDHSPLRLKGPHVLAHARFISDPPNAD